MFTGLVQAMGTIARREPTASGARLLVEPHRWDHRPVVGESIMVSGCCLTLAEPTDRTGGLLAFDAIHETLSRTTLGGLAEGALVNLERSLRATDLVGGHLVQGHVEGVGVFERIERGDEWRLTVRPPPGLMECVVPKGSVAVDGVSLTVARVHLPTGGGHGGSFEVALIPTTLALTTLGTAREGDACNIETDITARTVVHWLRHYGGGRPGRDGDEPR